MSDLKERISAARTRLESRRSERSRVSAALDLARVEKASVAKLGSLEQRLAVVDGRVRAARKVLTELQARHAEQEEEQAMRHVLDETPSMTPPYAGWTLRAKRTFNIGARTVGPGVEIAADELALMANSEVLLKGGYIAWMPPQAARQVRPAPAAAVPGKPEPKISYVERLRAELHRISQERGCSLVGAEDLVDQNLYRQALKEFCDMPHEIAYGGWGSGGGHVTQTGHGSTGMRRIPEGFREHVLQGAPA